MVVNLYSFLTNVWYFLHFFSMRGISLKCCILCSYRIDWQIVITIYTSYIIGISKIYNICNVDNFNTSYIISSGLYFRMASHLHCMLSIISYLIFWLLIPRSLNIFLQFTSTLSYIDLPLQP